MRSRLRLGLSLVLAGIFYNAAMRSLPAWSYYETHKWAIVLCLLTAGAILWPIGLSINSGIARRKSDRKGPKDLFEEDKSSPSQPFVLFDLAYWGLMLIAFSTLVVLISPAPASPGQAVAARTPAPAFRPPLTSSTAKQPTPAAPGRTIARSFKSQLEAMPGLKLQGLSYRPSNASALINGETYFVGDHVGKAKIVSIEPGRVVLEQNDVVKVLELGK